LDHDLTVSDSNSDSALGLSWFESIYSTPFFGAAFFSPKLNIIGMTKKSYLMRKNLIDMSKQGEI
jgi:hypothetical protein